MATITKTPQQIFGAGTTGDEFIINTTGSDFAIQNIQADIESTFAVSSNGSIIMTMESEGRQRIVYLDSTTKEVKISNKKLDDSELTIIVLNDDNHVIVSYKEDDGIRTFTYIPNRDDSPIKGFAADV